MLYKVTVFITALVMVTEVAVSTIIAGEVAIFEFVKVILSRVTPIALLILMRALVESPLVLD